MSRIVIILLLLLGLTSNSEASSRIFADKADYLDSTDDSIMITNYSQYTYTPTLYANKRAQSNSGRVIGETIQDLMITYWISCRTTCNSTPFNNMVLWMQAVVADTTWDTTSGNRRDFLGNPFMDVAWAYDWYKDELDPTVKTTIASALYNWGLGLYTDISTDNIYFSHQWWQNHTHGNNIQLLFIGLALMDDYSTSAWVSEAAGRILTSIDRLSRTVGDYNEHVSYSSTSNYLMIDAITILQQYDSGTYGSIITGNSFYQNYYKWFESATIDEGRVNTIDTGDSNRYPFQNMAHFFMKLYHEYGTAEYLNLANFYKTTYPTYTTNGAFQIFKKYALYTDGTESTLTPQPSLRTSDFWEDEAAYYEKTFNGSLVDVFFGFRAGFPNGWDQWDSYDSGESLNYNLNLSHSHPDGGQIVVWDGDENKFLVEDTSSNGSCPNKSLRQNVLTIDDVGQLGETCGSQMLSSTILSQTWDQSIDGLNASQITTTSNYSLINGVQLKNFYPTSLNISDYKRSSLWLKGQNSDNDVFIIFDRISLSTGTPTLNIRWFSQFNISADGNLFRFVLPANPVAGTLQLYSPSSLTTTITNNAFGIKGQCLTNIANPCTSGQMIKVDQTYSGSAAYLITIIDTDPIALERTITDNGTTFTLTEGDYDITMTKATGLISLDAPAPPGGVTGINGILSGVQLRGTRSVN